MRTLKTKSMQAIKRRYTNLKNDICMGGLREKIRFLIDRSDLVFDLPPPISIRPISLARRKFARWRLDIIIVTSRIPQPCDHHYQRNYHYQHIDRRLVSQFQSSRSFRIRNHFLFKLRVQVSSINLSAHHISVFLIFILFCFLFNRKYNCTNARLLFYD